MDFISNSHQISNFQMDNISNCHTVSGPFGYATSRQFNYSKFQNEAESENSTYGKSLKHSNIDHEHLDLQRSELHRSWPLKSSQSKVYRKENSEKPLIDLSDELDANSQDAPAAKSNSSSEIVSLFDSPLSGNSSQYGNLELPQPLIRDHSDPFEINLAYREIVPNEPDAKPKQTPPPRPKPIVYRRTSVESQHSSGESWQSFSPPKCTGIKLPPEYKKRDNATWSDNASVHSAYSVPPQKIENSDRKASFHSVGHSPQTPSTPVKTESTKAVIEELFAKSRVNVTNNKNILHTEDSSQSRSAGAMVTDQRNKNVDKAFDWLNDAINNFSIKGMGKAGSDPQLGKTNNSACYDEVPDENESHSLPSQSRKSQHSYQKGQYPVQYCEVPNEQCVNQTVPRYDDVPQFEDPRDVKLPIPSGEIYSPHSTTSTYSEWDDFDSDFDDDELTVTGATTAESPAPPLPHRDYSNSAQPCSRVNSDTPDRKDSNPHIFPIVQDGKQLSNTHYFLIPAKGEELVSNDHSERATAAVRPFSVDGNQDWLDEGKSRHDYQNLENLRVLPREMCQDPKRRTSHSAEDLTHQKSKSQSHFWTNESVDVNQTYPHGSRKPQYSRSVSHNSESLEGSIDAQRDKILALQEAVLGITDEECYAALCHCHGNVKRAIKHLKTEQLFRLGLAPRENCYRLLEALHWNLELACSTMLDRYKAVSKVSMESAV